jgi:hypothetical protein
VVIELIKYLQKLTLLKKKKKKTVKIFNYILFKKN